MGLLSISTTIAKDVLLFIAFYRMLRWLALSIFVSAPFHDIPGPKPESWVMGNLKQLFNAKGIPFHEHLVDFYGGIVKVYGFFGDEQLYISDPHAIQAILGKEQECFDETAVFLETNRVIFGPGLVATTGDLHKRQRKIAVPMFTTAQLTQIAPTFYDIANKFAGILQKELCQQMGSNTEGRRGPVSGVLDMSEWSSRVSLEMAGRGILGYSFDPLDSPVSNPYTSAIKELIPTLFSLALVRQFAPFLVSLGPAWFRRKLVEWTPNRAVQRVKEMSDVMHFTAQKILEERRVQLIESDQIFDSDVTPGNGKDVISMLLKANERAIPEERMSDNELTGQMTVLIFGAQDTTASALSRIYHLLAANPDVQRKLREELRRAYLNPMKRHTQFADNLDQETIMGLPWLDAVVKETLRLHPPVPFVRRTCVKDTVLPYTRTSDCRGRDASPSSQLSHVTVPKGTTLFVGIAGCNVMESVWGPDAKEWKPERWLKPSSSDPYSSDVKLPGAFSGMLSFLGGGRACIGVKFAMLEMKIILSTVLSKVQFRLTEDRIVWNLSQIISPSVSRTVSIPEGPRVEEEKKGLPLLATLDDLSH